MRDHQNVRRINILVAVQNQQCKQERWDEINSRPYPRSAQTILAGSWGDKEWRMIVEPAELCASPTQVTTKTCLHVHVQYSHGWFPVALLRDRRHYRGRGRGVLGDRRSSARKSH
jgi:hypothetical protein